MTDFGAQVVAAIQQLRTSTPRECDKWCWHLTDAHIIYRQRHSARCDEQWEAKIDARLAVCVEAMLEAAVTEAQRTTTTPIEPYPVLNLAEDAVDAGLAAFLAAAAQKETT